MKPYVDLVKEAITNGEVRTDRTGTGTKSVFGGQLTFDLRERFPLVTFKKTLWKTAFTEMLWFLRGEPNTDFLKLHGVKIWDDWADEAGHLGPIYGVQWRKWPGKTIYNVQESAHHDLAIYDVEPPIDQIKLLIEGIKNNPKGRRHIVTAWNPTYIDVMGLPPCHRDFQCYVSNDGYLDLMWAQRSWDLGLGAPFNIAQYGLLLTLLAQCTGLKPRFLKVNYGDAHVYLNHIEALAPAVENLPIYDCPTKLIITNPTTDIDSFAITDFSIEGYECGPFIPLPIAV